MKKPNWTRRRFLTKTGKVAGLATLSMSLLPPVRRVFSQSKQQAEPSLPFKVLNPAQAATLKALCEQIVPTDDNDPGATDARVVHYIDNALASHHAGFAVVYRVGLAQIEKVSQAMYSRPFTEITLAQQKALLEKIDTEKEPLPGWTQRRLPPKTFFRLVITHTNEGMYSDPKYGGNYNEIGWRMIRYPGRKAFGYKPPFSYYNRVIPEPRYPKFKPTKRKPKAKAW